MQMPASIPLPLRAAVGRRLAICRRIILMRYRLAIKITDERPSWEPESGSALTAAHSAHRLIELRLHAIRACRQGRMTRGRKSSRRSQGMSTWTSLPEQNPSTLRLL